MNVVPLQAQTLASEDEIKSLWVIVLNIMQDKHRCVFFSQEGKKDALQLMGIRSLIDKRTKVLLPRIPPWDDTSLDFFSSDDVKASSQIQEKIV